MDCLFVRLLVCLFGWLVRSLVGLVLLRQSCFCPFATLHPLKKVGSSPHPPLTLNKDACERWVGRLGKAVMLEPLGRGDARLGAAVFRLRVFNRTEPLNLNPTLYCSRCSPNTLHIHLKTTAKAGTKLGFVLGFVGGRIRPPCNGCSALRCP